MLDSYLGAMVGLALGDAIGELKQHNESLPLDAILKRKLAYTDDTALALGLLKAILVDDNLTYQLVGDHFLEAINAEPDRGYGGEQLVYYLAEQQGLDYLTARDKVDQAFNHGAGSSGDGAVMRITPLALYYAHDDRLDNSLRIACSIDHNSLAAYDSCALACKVVKDALDGLDLPKEAYLQGLIVSCASQEMALSLERVLEVARDGLDCRSVDRLLGNVNRSVVASTSAFPYALFCYLMADGDFEKCLGLCLETQGDCDTIAAIGCSFCGARRGLSGIPSSYYAGLENLSSLLEGSKALYLKRTLACQAGMDLP